MNAKREESNPYGCVAITRKAEPLFGRRRGNSAPRPLRYGDFCDKKSPPRGRSLMGGGVHLREVGEGRPVNGSLWVHDTLKASDVVAEPLTRAQC